MREAWVNVYESEGGEQVLGYRFDMRWTAERAALNVAGPYRRVLMLRVRERLPTGVRTPKFESMGQGI